MYEIPRRDGGLTIHEDDDRGDQISIEPIISTFAPVRGGLHCVCGAALESWSLRGVAEGSAELSCHRCHRVLGTIGLGVKAYR